LGQLQLGSAGLSYSSNKALGLEVHGKSGVLGIGLFSVCPKTRLKKHFLQPALN